ncbi:MAG: formate dehydrogenase accessory sulfurtransferase FdhD [Polyangiaceae bacterium]|nr:formate dehydrogenase accessory sulfurtransferase FdhD [Polyangiaceae bacterium]
MSAAPDRVVPVLRVEAGARSFVDDRVVAEEPLEIRVAGEPLAVTMRTPGHDRELALGFLFGEGLVRGASEVASLAHCGRPGDEGWGNVIDVTLVGGVHVDARDPDAPFARRGTITAACGVCGRRSIDDLLARVVPALPAAPPALTLLDRAASVLRQGLPLFVATGGCHAAALVEPGGALRAAFEDVGRHNAVDKLVGAMLLEGSVPLRGCVLAVSGRTSFEIVQKAAVAGVAAVVGLSAPSSLAVDLARRAGLMLAGFARAGRLGIYAGEPVPE